jgi:hypothetical protein
MITLQKIEQQLQGVRNEIKAANLSEMEDKKQAKSIMKKFNVKLDFLNMCHMYLETGPKESSLVSQRDLLIKQITSLCEGYLVWKASNKTQTDAMVNPATAFESESGLRCLRARLITLSYILELPVPSIRLKRDVNKEETSATEPRS